MEDFIKFVQQQCYEKGIWFFLCKGDHVNLGSTKCNGFFDARLATLAVACGKDPAIWHQTLVHEYGHMTQWAEQCSVWNLSQINNMADSELLIDLWLAHEIELNQEQLDKHIFRARAIEVDCENRTLKLIEEHNLPINKNDYAKRANAYMYFWTAMKKLRKWYRIGKEPYIQKNILELMPTVMKTNEEYDNIPDDIFELMKDCV